MISINVYFAKKAFMTERGDIYQMLEQNLAETGSRKISTIREEFEHLRELAAGRKNNIALAHGAIVKRLDSGKTFSESIAPFIPAEEALVFEAGQTSGNLVKALKSAQAMRTASIEINSSVAAAVAEPALAAVLVVITALFTGSSLWPQILKVIDVEHWPAWSLPLINSEIALAQNWQFAALIIFASWLYSWSMPRWTGKSRSIFDKMPPWSIYRDKQAATLLGVLGGLLGAGLELDAALGRIQSKSTPWLAWHVHMMRKRLAIAGANQISAMDTGLFSESLLDLIKSASRNRSFDEALQHLGSTALPLIVQRVSKMAKITGSAFAIAIGALFLYQVAVQTVAVNSATQKFVAQNS